MKEEYIKAIDLAKELNLYLKIVTATSTFESYNSFFNIYDQYEEACRRIVVLTPFKDLEEVYDKDSDSKIVANSIIDGNVWLKEFSLLVNPSTVDIDSIMISKDEANKLKNVFKC
ncbi:Uncharacterised protein [uncultured Clostridium sp.]|uniref:hypothetical protein n=1 Tax=uncultured Clostridium sp. TaxID=59620 RepID=UPI000821FD57|nr:hypothetical protein [uncultured Clostridium sp.]SCK04262.1 Uncharacterised protein [uncultured Clostridium sp.]